MLLLSRTKKLAKIASANDTEWFFHSAFYTHVRNPAACFFEGCPFSSSVGGTRLASFKNENRLSKCRFTSRLHCRSISFFLFLLSKKLEYFRVGCSQLSAIFHSINFLLERLGKLRISEKTWLTEFALRAPREAWKRREKAKERERENEARS